MHGKRCAVPIVPCGFLGSRFSLLNLGDITSSLAGRLVGGLYTEISPKIKQIGKGILNHFNFGRYTHQYMLFAFHEGDVSREHTLHNFHCHHRNIPVHKPTFCHQLLRLGGYPLHLRRRQGEGLVQRRGRGFHALDQFSFRSDPFLFSREGQHAVRGADAGIRHLVAPRDGGAGLRLRHEVLVFFVHAVRHVAKALDEEVVRSQHFRHVPDNGSPRVQFSLLDLIEFLIQIHLDFKEKTYYCSSPSHALIHLQNNRWGISHETDNEKKVRFTFGLIGLLEGTFLFFVSKYSLKGADIILKISKWDLH